MEVEVYKSLDPGVRVIILKALCDIRVEVLLLFNACVSIFLIFLFLEWVNVSMVGY